MSARQLYIKQWSDNNHERVLAYKQKWRLNNRQQVLEAGRKYRNKLRKELFMILGNRCIRCGFQDIRALQFDHINGYGTIEVKRFGGTEKMYVYYRNHPEEAREKLQILCANCNWIKQYERVRMMRGYN